MVCTSIDFAVEFTVDDCNGEVHEVNTGALPIQTIPAVQVLFVLFKKLGIASWVLIANPQSNDIIDETAIERDNELPFGD